MKLLPSGLFDDAPFSVNLEAATFLPPPQQPPAFDNHWQSQFSLPAPPQPPAFHPSHFQSPLPVAPTCPPPAFDACPPPAFEANWQAAMTSAPLHAPLCSNDWSSPVGRAPSQHPVVLDLANALSSPMEESHHQLAGQQAPAFANFSDRMAASAVPP